jgi:oligopeptide transport system substrate-binding protein
MIRLGFWIGFFGLGLIGFASCRPKPTDEAVRVVAGGIKRGGTFRTNALDNIKTLDPARIGLAWETNIGIQIYDRLIGLDPATLTLKPELASRWDISPDGLTYTFHLRRDVYFHNDACFVSSENPNGKGQHFTARDAAFSLTRTIDARAGSLSATLFTEQVRGAAAFYAATLGAVKTHAPSAIASVEGFIVRDDSTFVIQLQEPFAPFLHHLTMSGAFITCEKAATFYGDGLGRHPVGTGAFKFSSWQEDQAIHLERNANYWDKDSLGNPLPYLDGITFKFIRDLSSQLLEFKQGNLDDCFRLPPETAADLTDDAGKLKGEYKSYVLEATPFLQYWSISFLVTDKLFSNVKLRQAISSAIDREKLIKYVLKGQAVRATGIVPKGFTGYDNSDLKIFDYNLGRAKSLLGEAGYANGKGLPELQLNLFTGINYNKQVAEAVQSMLKDIGIRVRLVQTELATHNQLADAGKLNFFITGWTADFVEPSAFLTLLYGKVIPASASDESFLNRCRFINPRFDSLYAEALKTQDTPKRYALYKAAEQVAFDDAPMLVNYYELAKRLQQPYVRNYHLNSIDWRAFKTVWLDK